MKGCITVGRPKKPSRVRKFEGNRSKTVIVEEPVVKYKRPSCPRELPREIKKIWKTLAPDLIRTRKLNQFNARAFLEHCYIIMHLDDLDKAIYESCRSLLQENKVIDSVTGIETVQYKEAALSKIKRGYLSAFERSCKVFGFTATQFASHYQYEEGGGEDDPGLL